MSQMTDEQVKQAIERHGLTVMPPTRASTGWLAANAWHYAMKPTLTEAVAACVAAIEQQQKENTDG